MAGSLESFEAVASRHAPPDPAVLKAIGLNHSLESAVADLVDNSIDAGAGRVLIRFVLAGGLITQLLVVDDGRGMTEPQIDAAMVLGGRRERSADSLGHFGMGLKAASFSQASILTVLSKHEGAAVGRRMPRETEGDGFMIEELASAAIATAFTQTWTDFTTESGTIVMWDQIRTFPKSKDPAVTNEFVESKVASLRHYLGLIFHRILERRSVRLEVDVLDTDLRELGIPFEVETIDPFGYVRSGDADYPRTLVARAGATAVKMKCHIWPGRADSSRYRLAGMPIDRTQGFYLYRNDRLLSYGGWGGVTRENKHRRLARVAIDIDNHLESFAMTMEKAGAAMGADLVHAIEKASDDTGVTFAAYLEAAEGVLREANRRSTGRTPVLPPGKGIPPKVKRAIDRELPTIEGEEPIEIRWTSFDNDDFVEVDRRDRTLRLNEMYRPAVLNDRPGSLNDAPLLKALLYLVYEDIFRGIAFGPKDKDNVNLWREILNAAAREEWDGHG